MLTVADMGEGGVKNHQKTADILYGRSLIENESFFHQLSQKMTTDNP